MRRGFVRQLTKKRRLPVEKVPMSGRGAGPPVELRAGFRLPIGQGPLFCAPLGRRRYGRSSVAASFQLVARLWLRFVLYARRAVPGWSDVGYARGRRGNA